MGEALSSAPMPNSDRPISTTKPTAPPAMVNSVRRHPCKAPWVRASRLLGPGESDSPVVASR